MKSRNKDVPATGEAGKVAGAVENSSNISVMADLKHGIGRRQQPLSKKFVELWPAIRFIVNELGQGHEVNELDVYHQLAGHRFRKGYSLSAIREAHRRTKPLTVLSLEGGLWTIRLAPDEVTA